MSIGSYSSYGKDFVDQSKIGKPITSKATDIVRMPTPKEKTLIILE